MTFKIFAPKENLSVVDQVVDYLLSGYMIVMTNEKGEPIKERGLLIAFLVAPPEESENTVKVNSVMLDSHLHNLIEQEGVKIVDFDYSHLGVRKCMIHTDKYSL